MSNKYIVTAEQMERREIRRKNRQRVQAVLVFLMLAALIALGILGTVLEEDNWVTRTFGDSVLAIVGIFNTDTLNALLSALVYIIIIVAVYLAVVFVLKKLLAKSQRGQTIINLLMSFIKYTLAIVCIGLVLSAFGVDTTTLLASAGILALVIGLGAQSLIEDIIAGLFIVFEAAYQVGDIVVIDGFRGSVKTVGIRTTSLIDASGNVKIVNNSDIRNIINMSADYSLAICDVSIEYGESLERVENIIAANLQAMRDRIDGIVEGPFYKGVAALGDSGVTLRIIAKCSEDDRYQVERDLNREIKIIFDKNDINIPFPQVVINKPVSHEETRTQERNRANQFVDEQKELSKDMDVEDKD